MATAKKCDRCGKYYEPYHFNIDNNKFMNTLVITNENDNKTIDIVNTRQFDLCQDCCEEFIFWLKNKDARPIAILNNVMGTTTVTSKNI